MGSKSSFAATVLLTAIFLSGSLPAQADTKQIKAYKEAFPDEKPKCIGCHLDEKPKKEGPHDLNEYGKKVMEQAAEPTVESYQKAGKIPA